MNGPVCLLIPSLEKLETLATGDASELAWKLNALGYRLRSHSGSGKSRGPFRPVVPYKGTDVSRLIFFLRRKAAHPAAMVPAQFRQVAR